MTSRFEISDLEGDMLLRITDDYWEEFGRLVAKHLRRAPEELRELLLMQLQEHSSVYGSAYDKYMDGE